MEFHCTLPRRNKNAAEKIVRVHDRGSLAIHISAPAGKVAVIKDEQGWSRAFCFDPNALGFVPHDGSRLDLHAGNKRLHPIDLLRSKRLARYNDCPLRIERGLL